MCVLYNLGLNIFGILFLSLFRGWVVTFRPVAFGWFYLRVSTRMQRLQLLSIKKDTDVFFRFVLEILKSFHQDEGEWCENILFYCKGVKKISRPGPKGTLAWVERNWLYFQYFSSLLYFPSIWLSKESWWGNKTVGSLRPLGDWPQVRLQVWMRRKRPRLLKAHTDTQNHSTDIYWWRCTTHFTNRSHLCLLHKMEVLTSSSRLLW